MMVRRAAKQRVRLQLQHNVSALSVMMTMMWTRRRFAAIFHRLLQNAANVSRAFEWVCGVLGVAHNNTVAKREVCQCVMDQTKPRWVDVFMKDKERERWHRVSGPPRAALHTAVQMRDGDPGIALLHDVEAVEDCVTATRFMDEHGVPPLFIARSYVEKLARDCDMVITKCECFAPCFQCEKTSDSKAE